VGRRRIGHHGRLNTVFCSPQALLCIDAAHRFGRLDRQLALVLSDVAAVTTLFIGRSGLARFTRSPALVAHPVALGARRLFAGTERSLAGFVQILVAIRGDQALALCELAIVIDGQGRRGLGWLFNGLARSWGRRLALRRLRQVLRIHVEHLVAGALFVAASLFCI
jgi:hypothetical protein